MDDPYRSWTAGYGLEQVFGLRWRRAIEIEHPFPIAIVAKLKMSGVAGDLWGDGQVKDGRLLWRIPLRLRPRDFCNVSDINGRETDHLEVPARNSAEILFSLRHNDGKYINDRHVLHAE